MAKGVLEPKNPMRQLRRLLRVSCERPRCRGAEECDELPPPHGIDPGEPRGMQK
jgi:hypothetical protein